MVFPYRVLKCKHSVFPTECFSLWCGFSQLQMDTTQSSAVLLYCLYSILSLIRQLWMHNIHIHIVMLLFLHCTYIELLNISSIPQYYASLSSMPPFTVKIGVNTKTNSGNHCKIFIICHDIHYTYCCTQNSSSSLLWHHMIVRSNDPYEVADQHCVVCMLSELPLKIIIKLLT